MHSLGDENSVGDATFSKYAAIITTMDLLLFIVPDTYYSFRHSS